MKNRLLAVPWRFCVLVAFLLPAILPLLTTAGQPCTHDNVLHYFRITAMREAWRQGWTFSRWVPNLALGYGYPFFNFREPLPYLFGTLLYSLGIPLPLVLGLIYAGSLIVAAWGAFVLVRSLFDERAAWIAALAYGLGPYLLLDTFRRGNMPESVALALLPWLLVSFRRVILDKGRRPFVASVLLLAALFLSHNITSLLLAPFLGGYVIVLAYLHRERRAWPWAFVAVGLVLMLTAWFWFPALAEQDTVQLHLSRTTRNNDFHYNFATWTEMLLTMPAPYDANFLNPPMRVPLGLVQAALALAGVVAGLWRARTREQRALIAFFAAIAFIYLWLATPAAVRVWEAFSLLAFIQFPWRLVGRALLPAALLAGAVFTKQEARSKGQEAETSRYVLRFTFYASRFFFLPTLVALVIFSWPNTYPPKGFCEASPYPDLSGVYAFEREGWMGVDPEGSYFPVWVERHPEGTKLTEALVRGEEPARLDQAALPEGARVLDAGYHPLRATLTVDTPSPFRARWLGLYFPGWHVTVDGTTVPAEPEEDTGLLTFAVPAGRHEITVRFGATPMRWIVSVVSIVGVVAFAVAIWWIKPHSGGAGVRRHATARPRPADAAWNDKPWSQSLFGFANPNSRVLTRLALVLLAFKLVVIDRVPTPLRHARLDAGDLPEVTTALNRHFADGVTLLGYELPATALPPGQEAQIDLLWGARDVPSVEYHTAVTLRDAGNTLWSYAGAARPRGYEPTPPTTMWQPGQYAYDPHIVQPLPGTPPGEYRVVVALFDRQTLQPVSVLDAGGNPSGPDLTLGTLRVTPPPAPAELSALDVPDDAALQTCGALGLWLMTADRAQAAPGDVVGVRWVWEAVAAPERDEQAQLALRDPAGEVVRTWALPPSAVGWPTDRWQRGDRWVGRPVVRLPGSLETGDYHLETSVLDCGGPLAAVHITVDAPIRTWVMPDDVTVAGVDFGGQVRLAGYALESEGDTVRVRLVWEALDEITASYRVFLHLQDAAGRVIDQSDGEPVDWTRPTTGWAVGEIVSEVREVTLPEGARPGDYVLRVGMYLPGGERLRMPDGADAFALGKVP